MKNHVKNLKSILSVMLTICLILSCLSLMPSFKAHAAVEYNPASGNYRNVMYYGDWSVWGGEGNFFPSGMAAEGITHLNYAFLDFDAQGNLLFTDNDAALGVPADTGATWGAVNAGLINSLRNLRAANPNMRIGISVGGWSKSAYFSPVAANPTIRAKFVQNLCDFVKYTGFDFVDLDWEYPGSVRAPDLVDNKNDTGTPYSSPADKANYITLLQELRVALDAQGAALGKTYELSVALPATQRLLDLGVDIAPMFEIIDFGNIMTYDMRGAWDDTGGHHAALYSNPACPLGFSADQAVQYLMSQGAPANKIIIGVAAYTRGWQQVANDGGVAGLPGLFGTAAKVNRDADQAASGGARNYAPLASGDGGRNGGVWPQFRMAELKAAYPGMVEYWDDVAKAPYLYNAQTGAFFTFDNVRSIGEKTKYVKENSLGGVITWMASQDALDSDGKRGVLTRAIANGLYGNQSLPEYIINEGQPNVSVSFSVAPNPNNATVNVFRFSLKNNEVPTASGTVLKGVEAIYQTISSPKVLITSKSGATFSFVTYGSGAVSSSNGIGTVSLSDLYEYRTIGPGVTAEFYVNSTVLDTDDIAKIEVAQYNGSTIVSKFTVYESGGGSTPVYRAPIFTGVTNRTITVGDSFDERAGVTALDFANQSISFTVTGNVNTSVAGAYTLTYSATDSQGQTTTASRVITVQDQTVNPPTPPVFTGVSGKTIQVGDSFDPQAGVTATDAQDGVITFSVTGSVNTSVAGTYILTYSATNSQGLTTTAGRVITVEDQPATGIAPWDSTATYWAGDMVTYNGNTYRAKWWALGDIPGAEQWGPWELID